MVNGTLVTAGRVVAPDAVHSPGWVAWEGPRITGAGPGDPPRPPDLALPDSTLVPGLVDTHVHGGGGASFGADQDQAVRVVVCHLRHGTTSMMASLVTAGLDELEHSVRSLSELVGAAVLAGVHLEGPWLSPLHRGAHAAALLRSPTAADVARLLAAGGGAVRMVTLAPELDSGLAAVRQVVAAGAVAAVGHTDASYAAELFKDGTSGLAYLLKDRLDDLDDLVRALREVSRNGSVIDPIVVDG